MRRILIATDTWRPQINGVVRTLTTLQNRAGQLGLEVTILSPDGFPAVPLPTYPDLPLALPGGPEIARRIRAARPEAIHVATEGPIGYGVRRFCLRHRLPFTTSFMTRYPEYIAARFRFPVRLSYWYLRRFHAAAEVTMVSTGSLRRDLRERGFRRLGLWTRGVDTGVFRPDPAAALTLARPIFMNVGRLAIEKNLEAFLSLDLPGTKVLVGAGPQEAGLRSRYPDAVFLGAMHGRELAAHMAAADVFVFPSRTDTYGIVQLEALACGVPVAAFPVAGPSDVIGGSGVGVLHADLRQACLDALAIPRSACRAFALRHSWDRSLQQFVRHLGRALIPEADRARLAA